MCECKGPAPNSLFAMTSWLHETMMGMTRLLSGRRCADRHSRLWKCSPLEGNVYACTGILRQHVASTYYSSSSWCGNKLDPVTTHFSLYIPIKPCWMLGKHNLPWFSTRQPRIGMLSHDQVLKLRLMMVYVERGNTSNRNFFRSWLQCLNNLDLGTISNGITNFFG